MPPAALSILVLACACGLMLLGWWLSPKKEPSQEPEPQPEEESISPEFTGFYHALLDWSQVQWKVEEAVTLYNKLWGNPEHLEHDPDLLDYTYLRTPESK